MGWCGTRSGLGLPSCFLSLRLFPCAWGRPVDLLLCDLIVHRCRPAEGGPPYFIVNVGCFKKKKKNKKKKKHSEISRSFSNKRPHLLGEFYVNCVV